LLHRLHHPFFPQQKQNLIQLYIKTTTEFCRGFL